MKIFPMSEIAQKFFAVFARIEFAMKRCPDFRTEHPNKRRPERSWLEADWNKLAASPTISALYDALKDDPRAKELVQKPPKILFVRNGIVDFGGDMPPCNCMADVVVALADARNNLFHGEKGQAAQPREHDLLSAGLYIMERVLEENPAGLADMYNW